MKRIILFIGIFLLTVNLIGQTGTGWAQQRAKMNFKDSTNFVKAATFENTIIMNGSAAGSTTLRPFTTASGTLVYPTSAGTDTIATRAYARSYGGTGASPDVVLKVNISDTATMLTPYARKASPTFTGTVTIPSPFTLGATSVTATGTELNQSVGVTTPLHHLQAGIFNILDYGAVSGDGNEDATAIQNAINAAFTYMAGSHYQNYGGKVVIPNGRWYITKPDTLKSGVHIEISPSAYFTFPVSYTGDMWYGGDDVLVHCTVDGGFYYNNYLTGDGFTGIHLKSVSGTQYIQSNVFKNLRFFGDSIGIKIDASGGGWVTSTVFDNIYNEYPVIGILSEGDGNLYSNNTIQAGGRMDYGVRLLNGSWNNQFTNLFIWDTHAATEPSYSLRFDSGANYNYVQGDGFVTNRKSDLVNLGLNNVVIGGGHTSTAFSDSLVIYDKLRKNIPELLTVMHDGAAGTIAAPGAAVGIKLKSYANMPGANASSRIISYNMAGSGRGSLLEFQTHGHLADSVNYKSVMKLDYNGSVITPFTNTGTITDATGITHAMLSRMMYYNEEAETDITKDPQIVCNEAYARDGTIITIMGSSDTYWLKLDDGAGLQLAGGASFTLGLGDTITLVFNSTLNLWVELSRSDN